MKSSVIKRSIIIAGCKTSVSLENEFWGVLKEIAQQRGITMSELITSINADRRGASNLSSALRLFALAHLQNEFLDHLRQTGESDATSRLAQPPSPLIER